ncbi:xanthine phosphoribosyltransferase [Acidaminobacterium chupaoyuni]
MELLKQAICQRGKVKGADVLKVDTFLNHQLDITLLNEIGEEFARRFAGLGVNKILTIEASGIAIAAITAQHFNNVPVVFAKKAKSKNLDGELLTTKITSFTHDYTYDVTVAKKFLNPGDRVLILDDFLAKGNALLGLIDLVEQSGAELVGCGIVIEKSFDIGACLVRSRGVKVESLAQIEKMNEHEIIFKDEQ